MGKERPIIFSVENVGAILDGRKTQTRRVVTPYTSEVGEGRVDWSKFCWDGRQIYKDTCTHGHIEEHKAPLPFVDGRANENYPYEHQYLHVPWNWEEDMTIFRIYPRWEVGDRLWVRETWGVGLGHIIYKVGVNRRGDKTNLHLIKEIDEKYPNQWRPSIFMPRWASRITLELTGVRVERLQEITEFDAEFEGFKYHIEDLGSGASYMVTAREKFITLWDSLNAKRGYGWDKNPWCWVIKFDNIGVRVK